MTDDQIRAWLETSMEATVTHRGVLDCLTELLQHRELHRSIKWAVWVADQSAESGWKMIGAFWCEGEAHNYRAQQEGGEYLVLPFQERPCLTAR